MTLGNFCSLEDKVFMLVLLLCTVHSVLVDIDVQDKRQQYYIRKLKLYVRARTHFDFRPLGFLLPPNHYKNRVSCREVRHSLKTSCSLIPRKARVGKMRLNLFILGLALLLLVAALLAPETEAIRFGRRRRIRWVCS